MEQVLNGSDSAIRIKSVLFILSRLFEVRQRKLKRANPNAHQILQRREPLGLIVTVQVRAAPCRKLPFREAAKTASFLFGCQLCEAEKGRF